MKFISVRDLRGKSAEIWRQLDAEKDMVITSNGRPIAILSSVSEDGLEESLEIVRRVRAQTAVADMQEEAIKSGAGELSLAQINEEIGAVRQRRKR